MPLSELLLPLCRISDPPPAPGAAGGGEFAEAAEESAAVTAAALTPVSVEVGVSVMVGVAEPPVVEDRLNTNLSPLLTVGGCGGGGEENVLLVEGGVLALVAGGGDLPPPPPPPKPPPLIPVRERRGGRVTVAVVVEAVTPTGGDELCRISPVEIASGAGGVWLSAASAAAKAAAKCCLCADRSTLPFRDPLGDAIGEPTSGDAAPPLTTTPLAADPRVGDEVVCRYVPTTTADGDGCRFAEFGGGFPAAVAICLVRQYNRKR